MKCPDCNGNVTNRYCEVCGRFVSRPLKKYAVKSTIAFFPSLILLAVLGYIFVPVLGIASELMLWILAARYDTKMETDITFKGVSETLVREDDVVSPLGSDIWEAGK